MFGHKIVILPKQPTLIQLLEHQLLEAERNELDVASELEQARVNLATIEMRKHQAGSRINRLTARLAAARRAKDDTAERIELISQAVQ